MFFEIYYSYLHKESIMKEYYLTKEKIDAFASMLYQAEKSKATIEKYLRSIRMFSQYLAGNPVNKSAAITWKEQLQQQNNYAPSTVNAALAPLIIYFPFSDGQTVVLII